VEDKKEIKTGYIIWILESALRKALWNTWSFLLSLLEECGWRLCWGFQSSVRWCGKGCWWTLGWVQLRSLVASNSVLRGTKRLPSLCRCQN